MSLIVQKFDYKELKKQSVEGKRLYACPDGNHVASVTTILDKTKLDISILDSLIDLISEPFKTIPASITSSKL